MDDELDEYVNVDATDYLTAEQEVEELFESDDDGRQVDDENAAILALMEFESNRKAYIKDKVAEGMELADAKLAYDVNIGGTVNILECVRLYGNAKANLT